MSEKYKHPDLEKPFKEWLEKRTKFIEEMDHYHSNIEFLYDKAGVSEEDFQALYLKPFFAAPAEKLKYLIYMLGLKINERIKPFKLALLPQISPYDNAITWLRIQIDNLNLFNPLNDAALSSLTNPYRQCILCGRLLAPSQRSDLLKLCHVQKLCPGYDEKSPRPHKDVGCCYGIWGVKKESLFKRMKDKSLDDRLEIFLQFCSFQLLENMEVIKQTVRNKAVKSQSISIQGAFSEDWEEMEESLFGKPS